MLLFEKPSLAFGTIGIPPNAPEGTQPQARLAAILRDKFDAADPGGAVPLITSAELLGAAVAPSKLQPGRAMPYRLQGAKALRQA